MLAVGRLSDRILDAVTNAIAIGALPPIVCRVVTDCTALDLDAQQAVFRMCYYKVALSIYLSA